MKKPLLAKIEVTTASGQPIFVSTDYSALLDLQFHDDLHPNFDFFNLNIGSVFSYEGQKYKISHIDTLLMKVTYENNPNKGSNIWDELGESTEYNFKIIYLVEAI